MKTLWLKVASMFRLNLMIAVLLSVTVIAFLWYRYGMDDIYAINPATYPYIVAQTDSVDGGASVINMIRTDSSIIMDYELREGYPYPYASLQFYLGDGKTHGKDLSKYDSIYLWIKPRGEGAVRLYLRNWDSSISKIEDQSSLKFNELEFYPLEETYPAVFVPQEFRVASWWVSQNNVSAHKARVDLSNIPLIEIQTGTNAPLGYGTLEILGIKFKGKLISSENLMFSLIGLWFFSFFFYLMLRIRDYNIQRTTERKKREELEKNLLALEVKKDEFEKSSKEDPLTGCLNRAGFSSVLTREQERLNKNGSPLSYIILDIDHFKDVNDTWGHSVGDEVLVNLSKLVQSRIRNTDALVRWGGEEFVVLCSDTPLQNAQFLAEKLRQNIENTELISQQKVTCSFGVAEMVAGEDSKKLFERADKALYASKQSGRNRVTSAAFKKR
ncbi:MAG: GGDEF domain-containing protein [Fibrobacteraceae bacterium]